jgi:signal transduction histidine kinase
VGESEVSSIRRALTAWLVVPLGILAVIAGAAFYAGVRGALVHQFDATLRARAVTIEAATRWDGHKVDLDMTAETMPWYQPGPECEYFTLSEAHDRRMIAASTSLGGSGLPEIDATDSTVLDVRLPDGRMGRMSLHLFRPPPDEELELPGKEAVRTQALATAPWLRLIVAMPRASLDRTLSTIGWALALVCASGMVLLFGAIRFGLARGLRPLRQVSDRVAGIDAGTLSTRLPLEESPEELRSVCERINGLLERLDDAIGRERRFISAAAHELRTPIAELRSLLEVALLQPRKPHEATEVFSEALRVTLRAGAFVDTLLTLARQSRAGASLDATVLAVEPMLRERVRRHEIAFGVPIGTVSCEFEPETQAWANPAALSSIFDNLISNALEHSTDPGSIRCFLGTAGDRTVVEIRNRATELTDQTLDAIFEPFWRRDSARSNQNHVGLGLTVSRMLAQAMGGDLAARLEESDLLVIRLSLAQAAAGSTALAVDK